MPANSKLFDYLFDYTNTSDAKARERIRKQVWADFGCEGAVFVLDMSGYSRTSQERGIVYYLAMVQRMQIIVSPIIERYRGEIIKFEADNCFAWFPEVEQALDAAVGIQIAIEATNETTPDDIDIEFAVGIDHGRFLRIEKNGHLDFFGDAINRASKLGEDLGEAGEILVTREAMEQVEDAERFHADQRSYSVSGIAIEAFHIRA